MYRTGDGSMIPTELHSRESHMEVLDGVKLKLRIDATTTMYMRMV